MYQPAVLHNISTDWRVLDRLIWIFVCCERIKCPGRWVLVIVILWSQCLFSCIALQGEDFLDFSLCYLLISVLHMYTSTYFALLHSVFKSLFFGSRLNWTSRGSSDFWKTGVFSSLYWLPDLATLIWVIWAGNWHIYRHLEQLHLITRIKLGGTPGLVSVYFLRPARFEPGGRWEHLPVMPLLRGCGVVDQL